MSAINFKTINPDLLNQLVTKTLPGVATFLMVMVIAATLAKLTWTVIPSPPESLLPEDVVAIDSPAKNTVKQEQQSLISQIEDWHLFGQVPKEAPKAEIIAPPPPVVEDAPDTTLRLNLKGSD